MVTKKATGNKKKEGEELVHNASVLKKKIEYLEEELVRKDKLIEKLKEENLLLFRTALKRSENKVDTKKSDESKQ
jgi:hypothetical protein